MQSMSSGCMSVQMFFLSGVFQYSLAQVKLDKVEACLLGVVHIC